LSREVILFGLFIIMLGIYTFLPFVTQNTLTRFIVGIFGAIIGLAGTIATGEIYRLQARPAWDHWLAVVSFPLGALSAGSLFGYFAGHLLGGHLKISPYAWMGSAIFLLACLAVTLFRSIGYQQGSPELKRSRQLAMGTYIWTLGVRGLGVISALLLILSGGEIMYFAWIPAMIGEIADRYLFFKTIVPVTLRGRYI
jgi:DMSO reductase anchor subunit